jgi:hypothetical protein
VLRAVIEVPVLAVLHPRKHLLLRFAVAVQLIGDEHPRDVCQPPQPQATKRLCRLPGSMALSKNLEYVVILIAGPPEVMPCAIDGEKDFVQVPCVAGSGTPVPELMGIGVPELQAPLADGFVGHQDPTDEWPLVDIPIAQAEAVVQSDAVTDHVGWKTMVCVTLRRGWNGHAFLPRCLPTQVITSPASQG